jgi:hypothetical protein
MSVDLKLISLNAQVFMQPHGLERFLEGLQASGFKVSGLRVKDGTQFHSADTYSKQILALAYEKCLLDFRINIPTISQKNLGFEFFVQIGWGETHLQHKDRSWIGMSSHNSPLLQLSEYNPSYHAQFLLDIGKKLYSILLPDFAWIDYGDLQGYTWFDDLEESRIRHIYWSNYFGPHYLAGIGYEKILNAPAWQLEELEDGGLLYTLSPSPESALVDHVDIESVKQYFSIDSVR